MKLKELILASFVFILSLNTIDLIAQNLSIGDLAFVGFNADSNDDFALVALDNIPANSTIYITDKASDGLGGIASGEGILTWSTGASIIPIGSIISFNNVTNGNGQISVSIGSLVESDAGFNISSTSKDALLIYTGSDQYAPSQFICGIQIGNDSTMLGPFDSDGITLTNTGLKIGISLIIFDASASPDGGIYSGSRSNQTSYSGYFSQISDVDNNWTNIVNGDGTTFLPFSTTPFTTTHTEWLGAVNSEWDLSSNWSDGVPHQQSSVTIPEVINAPLIGENKHVTILNLSITETEGLTLKPGSSIIVDGVSSGNVNYQRELNFVSGNSNGWYLVSTPLSDVIFNDQFVSENYIAHGSANNRGIANFETNTNSWNYFQAGESINAIIGQGYSIKKSVSGMINFHGEIANNDVVTSIATDNAGYNLVGNPFPSYISSEIFLTANSNIDAQIWTWNHEDGYYTARPRIEDFIIAPSQGFFIKANSGNTVTFSKSNQQSNIDTFLKENKTEIKLTLTSNEEKRIAKLYYFDADVSEGHDIGFEGELFEGTNNVISIYSKQANLDNGKKYQIQSLPIQMIEKLEIPISVHSTSDEFTIAIETSNLPEGLDTYIIDSSNNSRQLIQKNKPLSFWSLDEGNKNRFRLGISSQVLSSTHYEYEQIKTWSVDGHILIQGIESTHYSLKVYDVLGSLISDISSPSVKNDIIRSTKLSKGLYLIHLITENSSLKKKILIQ